MLKVLQLSLTVVLPSLAFALSTPYAPMCFTATPGLKKIDPSDCADVLEIIMQGDKFRAPMTFTRKDGVGYKLPEKWNVKSCNVVIDMTNDDDEETFPMATVAQSASDLLQACVLDLRYPGVGGRWLIGPNKKVMMILAGIREIDTEKKTENKTLSSPLSPLVLPPDHGRYVPRLPSTSRRLAL